MTKCPNTFVCVCGGTTWLINLLNVSLVTVFVDGVKGLFDLVPLQNGNLSWTSASIFIRTNRSWRDFFFVTWISKTCFNKSFEQYVSHRNITLPFLCLFLCLLLLVVLGSMLIIITIRTKGRMALWLLTGVIRVVWKSFPWERRV